MKYYPHRRSTFGVKTPRKRKSSLYFPGMNAGASDEKPSSVFIKMHGMNAGASDEKPSSVFIKMHGMNAGASDEKPSSVFIKMPGMNIRAIDGKTINRIQIRNPWLVINTCSNLISSCMPSSMEVSITSPGIHAGVSESDHLN